MVRSSKVKSNVYMQGPHSRDLNQVVDPPWLPIACFRSSKGSHIEL